LTPTQWQFVEQLKEQAKNELKGTMIIIYLLFRNSLLICLNIVFKQPPPTTKADGTTAGAAGGTGAAGKRAGQGTAGAAAAGKGKGAAATAATAAGTGKGGGTAAGRPGTGKGRLEKSIDTTKAHWILRVVSDADKAV